MSPEGKPLKGIVFKAEPIHENSTKFVTDENGEVTIKAKEITTGEWNLVEEEQTIDGVTYNLKKIPIRVADNCYDGVCFEGEVSGNELGITYDKVLQESGLDTKGNVIEVLRTSEYLAAKEIDRLYKEELAKGGMWLKFTDYKYTRDGKPRTFYMAKKPLKKNLSWEQLYTAGVIYGPDLLDNNGKINGKLDSNKLKEVNSWYGNKNLATTKYKGKFMQANGKKYVVRLLRGKSNYGESIYGPSNIYKYYNDNQFSEWNRVMLPITKNYRTGSSTFNDECLEPALREGASHTIPANDYKVQSAKYNWFGDLTVGAYTSFFYNGEAIDDNDGTGSNSQLSWCQEFSNSAECRARRGGSHATDGAADSDYDNSSTSNGNLGFRPVLEFIGEVPSYDGMYFDGEVKGTDFITYKDLKTQVEASGKTVGDTLELGNDQADGGNWLKFIDTKYTNKGKSRTFYVAKKPITNNVSWRQLFNAGVVYGLDAIDKSGKVLPGVTGVKAGYEPKIIKINGKEYVVRLLQGRTNFNVDKDKSKVYDKYVGISSEWNRTILPITQGYRYGSSSINDSNYKNSLLANGVGNDYSKRKYKIQLANYNWFGDLTLGAVDDYKYNGVFQSGVSPQGQLNWCQEFSNSTSYLSCRGDYNTSNGAVYSDNVSIYDSDYDLGFRPVLELID